VSNGDDGSRGVVPDGVPEVLDRLAASPPVLIVTDFDGTLSPIVPDPPAARILPAARRALRRLAAIAGRKDAPLVVAVLSGRDAADVARRVGVAGPRYLGQHGIEEARLPRHGPGIAPIELAMDPGLAARGRQLEAAAARAAEALGQPDWLVLERKGASVGLHYRRAPDPGEARASLLAALDDVLQADTTVGAQVMESRRVVELRPAAAHGKGETMARLIRATSPGAVLVLGDDRTDAEAFDAVREWREAAGRPALIVGVSGAGETPAAIAAGADVIVADPAAAADILGRLADAFELGGMPAGR
jgi:trehalose 6-phosphate phosphatase